RHGGGAHRGGGDGGRRRNGDGSGKGELHRAIAVKVTVALWRPVGTDGRAAEKPSRVGQVSPVPAEGESLVPSVSAGAGCTGIGTSAPPASAGPRLAPAGAVAPIASGRSRGAKAVRATASE